MSASDGEIEFGNFVLGSELCNITALAAANVQNRSEMPDSAIVVRMQRRMMPHMRSA